ncbi:MAG: helix-turn-helix transcriptional regulator [Clostridia bacterium]|nr:helix-turn-helix transcriptional regulator [Clostridia bacterium]
MNLYTVGKNIKAARIRKKMTQDELAEKLFVTRQTVSNYETGKSRPDIEILVSIAEALDVEINEIIYGKERSPKDKKVLGKFIIIATVIAMAWIAMFIAMPHLKRLAVFYYVMSPLYILRGVVMPLMYFFLGWLILCACGLFLGAKPPQFPAKKKVRIVAFVLLAALLILLLPMLISFAVLAIEEMKMLTSDGSHSLSFSLGGNIPVISKISAKISMFLYRFPFAMLPLGALPWLLRLPKNKKEPL